MKRILQFDYFFLLILITATASSCGNNAGKKETLAFSSSLALSTVADLTTEERTIATRICYAYQSKDTSFRTSPYKSGFFNFQVDTKACDNKVSTYRAQALVVSNSNVLSYEGLDGKKVSTLLQTSSVGFLSQLCSKIQNNQPISNTVEQSGTKVQIRFFRTDLDTYTINYFSSTSSKILSAETFQVRTQLNLATGQILGIDERYKKQQVCANDATINSEFTQTFQSFSTTK